MTSDLCGGISSQLRAGKTGLLCCPGRGLWLLRGSGEPGVMLPELGGRQEVVCLTSALLLWALASPGKDSQGAVGKAEVGFSESPSI